MADIFSPPASGTDPLAVPATDGFRMLGVGRTLGWELIRTGELESFTIGRRRLVTLDSIRALIARRVAASRAA